VVGKILAVREETGEHWLEDSYAFVKQALITKRGLRFYPIVLDEHNVPSIGEEITEVKDG
jgi:hypothetical protein